MRAEAHPVNASPTDSTPIQRRTAYVLTTLAVLFLTFDTVIKLLRLAPAVQGTVALGYPEHAVAVIGAIELVCLVLYLVPRTAVLGAVVFTGYLGGAVATHLRDRQPAPEPHAVPDLRGRTALGRVVPAGPASARADAAPPRLRGGGPRSADLGQPTLTTIIVASSCNSTPARKRDTSASTVAIT